MCYSGRCPYEDYMGACRNPVKFHCWWEDIQGYLRELDELHEQGVSAI